MDNLTHTLAGWALGQTGLKHKTRKGLAALILGANMPDVDVFLGWVPWVPLAIHRGFTHGFVGGVLLMPPILAGLLWLLDRWQQQQRGSDFPSGLPMRFGWLLALSYLGTLTHPLLDWQTAYAIQLFSPFDSRWYHTDALFIIDLWIWLGLGAAIWISKRRESGDQPRWQRPPIVALAVLLAYIAANAGLSALARRALVAGPPYASPEVIVASPPPVLFWQRQLVWRQDGQLSRGTFDPTRSLTKLQSFTAPEPDGMVDPLARQAMTATPEVVRFMRWSILPMAKVARDGCRVTVSFNDARFADGFARDRFWLSVTVPTVDPGC